MDYKFKNIDIVIQLLKKNGLNQIVISPGGTNIAFINMVQDDPFFTCYSIVDERSAMYFAIGLYLQTGTPVVTSCTSAQATRNYIPGLTEAFYKRVPILAITMSKHPRFTYQEYMQAPDQISLPKDCVKNSYLMPFISDENDVYHSIRIANQAILELTHHGFGPVQLCIPWLDFPLSASKPMIRNIKRYGIEDKWEVDLLNKKIMIIVGEHRPFSEIEKNAIEIFSEKFDVMLYTNHLSNYHGKYSVNANLSMLTLDVADFNKYYKPDIIISIGGQTGDYPLYNMISRVELNNIEHWRISDDGDVVDTYDKLTRIYECSIFRFFSNMNNIKFEKKSKSHRYFQIWESLVKSLTYRKKYPFSHISIAQYLSNLIPEKSVVQFAILNSLRIWNFYCLKDSIQCYSNVGAFGIDGGLSTLIGQSMVTHNLCFMITGDLAFYYDMNSLGIRHIKNNLRVLIINNNGGIEFKLGNVDNNKIDRYIAAAGHFKNAEGWAKTCGFLYLNADNEEKFQLEAKKFVSISDRPIIFEVFVSDIDEAQAYNQIIRDNKKSNFTNIIKNNIKDVLSNSTINKIKNIIK